MAWRDWDCLKFSKNVPYENSYTPNIDVERICKIMSLQENLDKYGSYEIALQMEAKENAKIERFKERIKPFEAINTISEAKELAVEILRAGEGKSGFYVGNAKCIVINTDEIFRISLDSSNEFVCYTFE